MIYFADLHIHSRFSRATSRDCNLVELARWGSLKGIRVLATGDFTHPEWSREIRETLDPDEDGLFRLKSEHIPESEQVAGGFGPADVRFLLNVEISSIYKKNGATRKVHNLVFMPDLDAMDRFNARLDRIGNIKSDGRPILGLDSRDLLEIALESSADSFFIPAHIWTPWFSVLGSRSGFDSLDECFEDLTEHVFALETGLSSDPAMNHRVASLDRYTLISNSDTHSPANLGREANVFEGRPGYVAIREAIRSGGGTIQIVSGADSPLESIGGGVMFEVGARDGSVPRAAEGVEERGFLGTIEFFPEEGKYHLDGHRKCAMRLDPRETDKLDGICPVCGKGVTVGVMNRVMELADRNTATRPAHAAPFWPTIPLAEIIGQALGVGPKSKKVTQLYMDLLKKIGPELMILWARPIDEIARHAPRIVVEGISRVRKGQVSIQAGFDGEYGTVQLFTPDERNLFQGQATWMPVEQLGPRERPRHTRARGKKRQKEAAESPESSDDGLNAEQREALAILDRPVLVRAGPGTGKTRTLTHRATFLIEQHGARPGEITAVTFTRKAAAELHARLAALLSPETASQCRVGTFHQLGAAILDFFRNEGAFAGRERILDRDESLRAFRDAMQGAMLKLPPGQSASFFDRVSLLKQNLLQPADCEHDEEILEPYRAYEAFLEKQDALDLDDLVLHPVRLLRDNPSLARRIAETRARYLLVDEFQDVNRAQYEMVRLLGGTDGTGLFVIGDPDQAIYGFRGADWRYFLRFREDYPSTREVRLTRNYRSLGTILRAGESVLDRTSGGEALRAERLEHTLVRMVQVPNAVTEGIFITRAIDAMLGGSSFLSLDSGVAGPAPERELGFSDFAVLYRLNAVGDALEEAFHSSGIPFQRARRANPKDEVEALDPRAQAVTLMTIHASKGLEFPVVFVAGCEDGIIPCTRTGDSETRVLDMDEERRLLYVAITRAETDLFLTSARARTLFGKSFNAEPSPFLGSIDRSICQFLDPLAGRKGEARPAPVQYELFQG